MSSLMVIILHCFMIMIDDIPKHNRHPLYHSHYLSFLSLVPPSRLDDGNVPVFQTPADSAFFVVSFPREELYLVQLSCQFRLDWRYGSSPLIIYFYTCLLRSSVQTLQNLAPRWRRAQTLNS